MLYTEDTIKEGQLICSDDRRAIRALRSELLQSQRKVGVIAVEMLYLTEGGAEDENDARLHGSSSSIWSVLGEWQKFID